MELFFFLGDVDSPVFSIFSLLRYMTKFVSLATDKTKKKKLEEGIGEAYSLEYFSVYPPFLCFSPLVVGFGLLRIVYFLVSEAQTRGTSQQFSSFGWV